MEFAAFWQDYAQATKTSHRLGFDLDQHQPDRRTGNAAKVPPERFCFCSQEANVWYFTP